MPHLLDTDDRVSVLARACNRLLAEAGPTGLTLRAISRASGVSTSSITHHLQSRDRLLRVCADVAARARITALTDAVIDDGPTGVLPGDDHDLEDTRAWLGWLEVWRTFPRLGPSLAPTRNRELGVVDRAVDHAMPREALSEVRSLVDGLRVSVCLPDDGMDLSRARACLAARLTQLTGTTVEPGRPLLAPHDWTFPYVVGPRRVARSDPW